MTDILLDNVSKAFGAERAARQLFQEFSLRIHSGSVVAIRGDNGAGKTTLLHIIAGIERIDCGRVSFSQPVVRIGLVPQNYSASLLPWLTAVENAALPLQLHGQSSRTSASSAARLLEGVKFRESLYHRYPHELSGGQQQRLAIARALAYAPDVLLLDEPFASLDITGRRELHDLIARVQSTSALTTLLVSHDLDDCLLLADHLIFLIGAPAKVGLQYRIELPRPRGHRLVLSHVYTTMRTDVLTAEDALYGEE